jgi:hypothetical protein
MHSLRGAQLMTSNPLPISNRAPIVLDSERRPENRLPADTVSGHPGWSSNLPGHGNAIQVDVPQRDEPIFRSRIDAIAEITTRCSNQPWRTSSAPSRFLLQSGPIGIVSDPSGQSPPGQETERTHSTPLPPIPSRFLALISSERPGPCLWRTERGSPSALVSSIGSPGWTSRRAFRAHHRPSNNRVLLQISLRCPSARNEPIPDHTIRAETIF